MPQSAPLGHRSDERSVVHLVGPPRQVVDAGLERQRHSEPLRSRESNRPPTATPVFGLAWR